jgi:enoyl-CoA hydratase
MTALNATGVQTAIADGVMTITLDDGKVNALTYDRMDTLDAALDEAEREGVAVLLVGRPGRFCAGLDMTVMTSGIEAARAMLARGARLFLRLFTFPRPVVVACTGHALAGGAIMLLAADRRIGARGDFKIGLNEVGIGLPLPEFGLALARYRMPPSAFDMVVLGDVTDPDGAVAAGFLDRVVEPDALVDTATDEARRLAALSPHALARTKLGARAQLAADVGARVETDLAALEAPDMATGTG